MTRELNLKQVVTPSGRAVWQLRTEVPGAPNAPRRQLNRRFDTEQEALAFVANPIVARNTVNDVLDDYLASLTFTEKTRYGYASCLMPVRQALGERTFRSITATDVTELREALRAAAKPSGPGRGQLKTQHSVEQTLLRFRSAFILRTGDPGTCPVVIAATPDDRPCIVYVIGADASTLVKIGNTVSLPTRLNNLQAGSPVKLRLLQTFPGGEPVERRLHLHFREQRRHGEWFDLGDNPVEAVREALSLIHA